MDIVDPTSKSNSTSEDSDEHDDGVQPNVKTRPESSGPTFIFTYNGRPISEDMTVDDVGIEDGDTIVAVEMVDLTEVAVRRAPAFLVTNIPLRKWGFYQDDELVPVSQQVRLKKNWTSDPSE